MAASVKQCDDGMEEEEAGYVKGDRQLGLRSRLAFPSSFPFFFLLSFLFPTVFEWKRGGGMDVHVTIERLTSIIAINTVCLLLKENSSSDGMRSANTITIVAHTHILSLRSRSAPRPYRHRNQITLARFRTQIR